MSAMPDSRLEARIEQFRKMAEADPGNELGHFSLGRACLEAGQLDSAMTAFRRVLEINPKMSRAYQLLAQALLAKGERVEGIEQLMRGAQVAHERGDLMPRNEMAQSLRELGASPPPFGETASGAQAVGQGQVHCQRCGQIGPKLPKPPFRNAQGQQIHEKVCAPCWKEWIAMGTKVINELRLPLADPQAQRIYDSHMMEFLNLR